MLRSVPLLLAMMLITGTARAQADPPTGLWASEIIVGDPLRGELTVTRGPSDWSANIASVAARFQLRGDSVRFRFPADLGEFRGAIARDGRTIRGFWVQPKQQPPPSGNPGGLSQPFAHPLKLTLAGSNTWTGNIVPLESRYTLYLSIWKAPSGRFVAAFRNPEANHRGGNSQFRASREGDSLVFLVPGDSTRATLRRTAFYDSTNRQVVINWRQLGRHMVLAPIPDSQAVSLYGRIPHGMKYDYRAPMPATDGWRSARAREAGLDETQLEKLVQRIADTIPTLSTAPFIHSLLIAKDGKLVLEEYFAGYNRERPHDTRSAGKTFASVMLGALMYQGVKVGPETTIAELVPRLAPFANPDPRKSRITLAHLMTHTSGLDCDDNSEESAGNEGTMQSQSVQRDWWKYTLDLPVKNDPGSWYAYCSGGSNLVGAGVASAAKTWLPEYFDRAIARPLQFGRYYYNLTPTGEGYTGGGVHMRPRDLIKFGQLFLDSGSWNGKRIVSREWVALSTKKHVEWPRRDENVSAGADGLAWHLNTIVSGGRSYRQYEANGNGGQLLMVLPELRLVVVFTAGNYGNGFVWGKFRDDLLPNAIIPAIIAR